MVLECLKVGEVFLRILWGGYSKFLINKVERDRLVQPGG
jgi:hypothetical protein